MREGGNGLARNPASRRATVVLFGLCVVAASAIAGAALYRYFFWGDQLPGGFAAGLVDRDGDGAPEYLITRALVDLPEAGDYSVNAVLLQSSTGAAIAQTSGRVELDRGSNVFGAGFWGPDIRRSGIDGPYVVRLTFTREQRDSAFEIPASPDMVGRVYEWSFRTPAYGSTTFQAQPVAVSIAGPVTAVKGDYDGDGKTDSYTITVPLSVRQQGFYSVRAESDGLFLQGVTNRFFGTVDGNPNTVGAQFVTMAPGPQDVVLSVQPEQVYLSGIDGPLDVRITVLGAQARTDPYDCCNSGYPDFVEEPAFAAPPDGSEFGLRQPYVLPPSPLGLKAEARYTETVHWYDFEAPWMPIEFTGEVKDYGTDADADGLYETLTIEAGVIVHTWGSYDISGTLYAQGSETSNVALMRSVPTEEHVVTTSWGRVSIGEDTWVRIDFAGAEILGSGKDGPYDAKLRIVPANVVIDPIVVHTTAAYSLSQFEAAYPKSARIASVSSEDLGDGNYAIRVNVPVDSSYTVITRVIHANGVVALEVQESAGGEREYYFSTEAAAASDFAIAVYLQAPSGDGADYLEIPLAVG